MTALILSDLLYMTAVGITMAFLFLKSRLPRRRTALIFFATVLLLMVAEVVLTFAFSVNLVLRLYGLIVHLPTLLVTALLSQYRGWRLLFQFLSSFLFCAMIQQAGGLAYYFAGRQVWAPWLAFLLLTPAVLWLLHSRICPVVFQALNELRRGWALICLSLLAYWLIVSYLFPGYVGLDAVSTFVKPMFSLLMVGFYCVLILLFSSVKREAEARYHTQLTELSLSALQSRMEAIQTVEETIRIQRHDLRHRFRAISELVSQGKTREALDFIGAAQTQLDEQKPVHWCRPPILDAVFSSYFSQARQKGIRVDAKIALAERLPVDEAELAIVFSNALENAVHACMDLPEEQREIRCKAISYPGLMFEISNPYTGTVQFDEAGLPVNPRQGHGVGSHSIAAFCEKYGASCRYAAEGGRFSLRVIL